MWLISPLLLLALQTPAPVPAPAPTCKIVVLNLQARNFAEGGGDLPALLSEAVAKEVAALSKCQVVSQADLSSMLDLEAAKVACGSEAESCLAEVGAALGAEQVVGGSVGAVGTSFVVSTRMMDAKRAVVTARGEATIDNDIALLPTAAKNAARQLFGASQLPYERVGDGSKSILPVVLMGAGAALMLAGGGAAGAAEWTLSSPTEKTATKDTMTTVGYVGLGAAAVGVVCLVGGGIWWLLE
jgi:hypothetical protein